MKAPIATLVALCALTASLFAQEFLPIEKARTEADPKPDIWSRIQSIGLNAVRLDTSRGVKILVIPIEFVDSRPSLLREELAAAFFGDGNQSLAAYYRSLSGGSLEISGEVHDPVSGVFPRLCLDPLPGVFFSNLYFHLLFRRLPAKTRQRLGEFQVVVFVIPEHETPGWAGLLWPHAATLTDGKRTWRRIVLAESSCGGEDVFRYTLYHEFGHSLGIGDKYCYARAFGIPHECETDRFGPLCLMGWGSYPCAWCRVHLGWVKPTILAQGIDQALRLAWLEAGGGVAKIHIGSPSEYLLVSMSEGRLRVWHLGQPLQRSRNHLLWIDLGVALDEPVGGLKRAFLLPGGIRLEDVHVEGGELLFRVVYPK